MRGRRWKHKAAARARCAVAHAAFVSLVTVANAAAQGGTPARPTIRDSAGVRIVEHRALSTRALTLEPRPWLQLGGLKDNEAEEFNSRAMRLAPVFLPDGRIAVSDLTTIKFFDRNGRFLQSVGRPGPGPGEFTQIGSLCPFGGDSLLAYDYQDRRLSVWTSAGTFVRAHKPVGNVSYMIPCYADGSVVVQLPPKEPRAAVTMHVRVRTDGSTVRELGELPVGTYVPIDRYVSLIPTVDRLHLATAETYEIRTFTHDGRLASILRVAVPPIALTEAMLRDQLNGKFPEGMMSATQRNAQIQRFMAMPRPASLPAYGHVKVDPVGRIWVGAYQDWLHWTVFDPSGAALGTVRLPTFNGRTPDITALAHDGVVLDHTDADGARVLSFYRIREFINSRD